MSPPGKRRRANLEILGKIDGPQDTAGAVSIVKSFKEPKFDQAVEVCIHLGIDPKHADQQLRGSISMPNGTGKTARVICFCNEGDAEKATTAGAIEAGGDALIEKIEGGWLDFDIAVASPTMMKSVSKLGRILGTKGLMPSPKAGTVTEDIVNAVREYSTGKTEYRNDEGGNISVVIGKMSFDETALVENCEFLLETINTIRPASVKGDYIKKIVICGSMTPGVQIAV